MSWRERYDQSKWPYPSPKFSAEELRSKTTALLLIDMQNYLHYNYGVGKVIRERYPDIALYYLPRVKDIVIPNVSKLLDFFRKKGLRIFYTTIGPELPDGSDMVARRRKRNNDAAKALGAPHLFPKGTTEHEIMQEVKPRAGELVINKNCCSPFNCTGIDQILHNMGIENLVIAGISTDACVITTARDAADRGYNCVVVEDACASFDQFAHEAALLNFARTFGVVMNCDELFSTLGDRT